jgi:hypothetical protein
MDTKLFFAPSYFIDTFDNDNDALIVEHWANEALMVLHEKTVMFPLVHTDYNNDIKRHGDVVNTHRPAKFEAERKVDGDNVTVQDAQSANVPIRLDHHLHTSFIIYDGEESKSFKELVQLYLAPAMQSLAQEVDEIIAAQKYQFRERMVGKLGTDIGKSDVIQINKDLNELLAPQDNQRYFVMSPNMEANLLDVQLFTDASQVGDDGTALREASIGKKFGVWNIQSQNMRSISGTTSEAAAVNNSGGYPAGTTVITIDGSTGDTIAVGNWVTIAGDMQPRRITAVTGSPVTEITLDKGLKYAVADDAVVTVYTNGAIDLAAGYDQYYTKRMTVDGFTVAPQQGQLATIGTDAYAYGMIGGKNTTTSIKLDRGLEAAAANNAIVNLGPDGDYGFAFHRNAVAFITRPLALPKNVNGTSTKAAVVDYKGLNLRITMTYDANKQGTLVTIDCLAGVKVLDNNLGLLVCG